jgi:class 3 adenylate cyclase
MNKAFEDLLLEYMDQLTPERRKPVEERLWERFGTSKAVLVIDLSRFSTLTERYGIVHNLAMIRRMQLSVGPLIQQAGGTVVKYEADNCYAMFDEVLPAVQAAIAIHQALHALNLEAQEEFEISVGIGIDFGEVLLTGGSDYFGLTVNRACKLGEDVAGAGEILVTAAAYQRLPPDSGIHAEPLELTVSGLALDAVAIKY